MKLYWWQILLMAAFWVLADLVSPPEISATVRVLTFTGSLLTLAAFNRVFRP